MSTTRSLAFIASILFILLVSTSHAGITVDTEANDVNPTDPDSWTSSTDAYIGNTSNGTLLVDGGSELLSNSAYLGCSSGSAGAVTVDGTDSTWTLSEYLYVGKKGTGTLEITNGGKVSSSSAWINGYAYTSTVTVNGIGSSWVTEGVRLGEIGNGILSMTNGGSVTATICRVSNGTLTVDGSTSSFICNCIYGKSRNAMLNIMNGSAVSVSEFIRLVDDDKAAMGTINFGDNGGTLTTGEFYGSPSQVTGTGAINTSSIVSDIDLTIDSSHGLVQTLPFNNSTLNLDLNGKVEALGVGCLGNGSMTIQDGMNVYSDSGYLGYSSGSNGTATVDGTNSKWKSTVLYVGNAGNGTLAITNGSTVSTSLIYIAAGSSSTGTITIDGEGSTLACDCDCIVGFGGDGTLNITNGGLFRGYSHGISILDSAINMDSNGMLELYGSDVSGSLNDFLVSIFTSNGTINYWDASSSDWAPERVNLVETAVC